MCHYNHLIPLLIRQMKILSGNTNCFGQTNERRTNKKWGQQQSCREFQSFSYLSCLLQILLCYFFFITSGDSPQPPLTMSLRFWPWGIIMRSDTNQLIVYMFVFMFVKSTDLCFDIAVCPVGLLVQYTLAYIKHIRFPFYGWNVMKRIDWLVGCSLD